MEALSDVSPLFKKGNCLLSVFKLNAITIVDLEIEQVVWALSGMWVRQHQPTLLPSGNMLVFDNQGWKGKTQVIEFDPFTQRVAWAYRDSPATPLYSELCGSCQRLPNGNTLITDSMNGRAFEVTPGGVTVWEYRSPHRAGEDDELVAVLFEVVRLSEEFPTDWLNKGAE